MKGNEAIAEAAFRAGCGFYAGYPITPQNEITAYMARRMLSAGRVFIQAESEVAAVNMVYGAASAGSRAMTSSSSPGVSLKQEGVSYAAGADVPFVLVNVCRGGPGLGSIAPAQSDYFQSTRGGGHGDYRCVVLAPKSVQECADLTFLAFELTAKWRVPALLLADGLIGQMMEGVVLPPEKPFSPVLAAAKKEWAVGGGENRAPRHITSLHLDAVELNDITKKRFARYGKIADEETRFEAIPAEGGEADIVIAAYGSSFRSALGARLLAQKSGIRVSIFRPITLWPFPSRALSNFIDGKPVLVVEMSQGQMIEDVKLSLYDYGRNTPVHFFGCSGGLVPGEEEIFRRIKELSLKNG
jgi:2-oxoglutarate ferredoxin oxidoreductase subunit alpha